VRAQERSCLILRSKRDSVGLQDRLAALPLDGLPLREATLVHWNDHQVPFVEAQTDHDLAVALGVLHVHLRWAQLELMRHVARGRLSELIGPFGVRLDRVLRTLDFAKAVPAILESMPAETRAWAEAFIAGMNHAIGRLPAMPPEFRFLGLSRKSWDITDVLAIVRLAASDVTWQVWLALLPQRHRAAVAGLWRRLLDAEAPLDLGGVRDARRAPWGRFARPGSNSWAIAPARSQSGGAWIASDTHLPALLPNLFLIAGCRSPSYHAVGLMVPGVPAFLLGRNPWIAWGGTNLHAASSDLFDVSDLPANAIGERRERLRVRFWGHRTIRVHETAWGPIISRLGPLRSGGGRVALRWMGHRPSDELTALLAVNRARDWESFRAALDLIAVPGQNMTYADAAGHIGKALAAHLPHRSPAPPGSLLLPRSAGRAWDRTARGRDLPSVFDPPEGFVASANNRPPPAKVLIGYFFSSDYRIERQRQALQGPDRMGFAELAALQRDTLMQPAARARDRLAHLLRASGGSAARDVSALLAGWDGRYDSASAAPLAFELLLFHLGVALYGRRVLRIYSSTWNTRQLLFRDIEALALDAARRALAYAVPRVLRGVRRFRTWGAMHRLEPRHVLASVPFLGRVYRFGEWAADGGSDTLMKTAHPPTDRRHRAGLASTARHISDLSDMDANWFTLLGGQDGWLGSTTLFDQTRLWREGAYVRMPLRLETVRAEFRHGTEFRP
jgi:penicillin amidase